MAHLRSFVFLFLAFIFIFVFSTAIVLSAAFPYEIRFKLARGYGHTLNFLLKVICNIEVEVQGEDKLPKTPCVVLLKHSSPWETIQQLLVIPPHAIILKRELMWIPIFGWALASIKSIAINRKAGRSARSQILYKGQKRLAEGIWVTIFPEGTRVRKGVLGKFGAGGALLACKAGVPVVPVAHNAADHWPNGELLKKPGKIIFRIGDPIQTTDKTTEQVNTEAFHWMKDQMLEISRLHQEKAARTLKEIHQVN